MRASSVFTPMAVGLSLAVMFLTCTPGAHAETIDIVFTGLDFTYDDPQIFDATSDAGRNLDSGQSDSVTSAMFSTTAGDSSDTSDVYADILVQGVSGISEFGGSDKSSNGGSFGIDLFSTDGTPWSLQLDLTELNVVYSGLGISVVALGKASGVHGQSLPFGLPAIDTSKPIQVSIVSGSLSNVQTTGGALTAFNAANGVGTISATLVPEPTTLVGLLMGALSFAAYAWKRRKR